MYVGTVGNCWYTTMKRQARTAHVSDVAQTGWNKRQTMVEENDNYCTGELYKTVHK
jgi:hypothetical protein